MARYWTSHWQFRLWRDDINPAGEPITGSGSNSYQKRGVAPDDVVYIVSLSDGHLYLGGRMPVKRVVSRAEAVRIFGTENLYEADDWIIDEEGPAPPCTCTGGWPRKSPGRSGASWPTGRSGGCSS